MWHDKDYDILLSPRCVLAWKGLSEGIGVRLDLDVSRVQRFCSDESMAVIKIKCLGLEKISKHISWAISNTYVTFVSY